MTCDKDDIRLATEVVKHLAPIGLALRGIRLARAKAARGADMVALICVSWSSWAMITIGSGGSSFSSLSGKLDTADWGNPERKYLGARM